MAAKITLENFCIGVYSRLFLVKRLSSCPNLVTRAPPEVVILPYKTHNSIQPYPTFTPHYSSHVGVLFKVLV